MMIRKIFIERRSHSTPRRSWNMARHAFQRPAAACKAVCDV